MLNKSFISFILLCVALSMLNSCYNRIDWTRSLSDSTLTAAQKDSITFIGQHHYGINYNFVVKADSVTLIQQQPEEYIQGMMVDSFQVFKENPVVVADFKTFSEDSYDSIWIELATADERTGWIHETTLRKSVVPDDPISQFIDTFSNSHLIISLIIIVVIGGIYLIVSLIRRKALLVHFNDIPSFYPTLLALLVATAATLYANIQKYDPDIWLEFYYHPTLNPFILPTMMCIFIISIWTIIIIAIATIDDVTHTLKPYDALLYLLGLLAVCAIDYLLFSLVTLYFWGYFLLAAYFVFAVGHFVYRIRKEPSA